MINGCSLVLRPHTGNDLPTSTRFIYYFCCQKFGSTNQISKRCHMTTVKLHHALKCLSHAHSISIAVAQACYCRCSADDFCSNDFCFTSIVEPAINSCFHDQETTSHSWKIMWLIHYSLLEWDITIAVMLHPYTVNKLVVWTIQWLSQFQGQWLCITAKQICNFDYTVATLFTDKWRHVDQFLLQKIVRRGSWPMRVYSGTSLKGLSESRTQYKKPPY